LRFVDMNMSMTYEIYGCECDRCVTHVSNGCECDTCVIFTCHTCVTYLSDSCEYDTYKICGCGCEYDIWDLWMWI